MPAKHERNKCAEHALPIQDCLDVISGKWKLPILGSLMEGKKRFKELERAISHITPRMLSKELRALEMNQLVKRTVYDTVIVEYEMAPYGHSLRKVLNEMNEWGTQHRKRIMTTEPIVEEVAEMVESCV
jgi:DNA-binding HxlR family transcriptional regulator